nr:DUF1127 domain-containing protein [Pseudomonas sp. R5(2019)]
MMKGQKGFVLIQRHPLAGISLGHWFSRLTTLVARWHQLARERAELAQLSDSALKDMGLSRADILEETERPFWDDPLKK